MITKRSGKEEVFQVYKIMNSLRKAGIGQNTAEEIVVGICYHEGITTSKLRNRIIGEIKNREPQFVSQYESHQNK
ncbi:MAG: ATP cone domain-containing protein [bacterium]